MRHVASVHCVYFTAQIIRTDWEICSVLYRMLRLFKLTGSICIRHPTMPWVLGCKCCRDQRRVLDVGSVFVEILWRHGDKALKYRIKQDWQWSVTFMAKGQTWVRTTLTKFSLYFSFTVSYFYEKDKRVVLEYFYLLYLLFWEILNLNLTFAICRKLDSKSV